MEVIIFEKEAYKQMLVEMRSLIMRATSQAVRESIESSHSVNDWVKPAEAKKLLKIKSNNKLVQLRDSGEIRATLHKNMYLYSRDSIAAFFERHKIEIL